MSDKQPIATAPLDGKVIFVGDEAGNIAKAFWRKPPPGSVIMRRGGPIPATVKDGMWAYVLPEGETLIHQLDFEPTHWSERAAPFLDQTQPSQGA